MSTYQPGIPTGTVTLNVDYKNIQKNFQQADTSFGKDHVPFSNPTVFPDGYHKAVHLVPVSTTASHGPNNQPINGYTATPGFGQVLSAQINDGIGTADEALFFLSGGNKLTQFTRNFVPLAAIVGYTFLPGGLILQWGNSASATVTLPLPAGFPNALFMVQATSTKDPAAPISCTTPAGLPVTQLIFSFTGHFFWMALGN